ncbi:tetratricopeptide repeat protein [Maribacter sp. CXY002]|uniref:tetratricopeptide repeat protein n=1 Tax=Maribacter luteocoastalis TaxID=3407671 RepID=UPI003B66E93B
MKYNYTLFFFCLLYIQNAIAQNKVSLIEKFEAYEELYMENRGRNQEIAAIYIDSMRLIAKKKNDFSLLGKAIRAEGALLAYKQDYRVSKDSTKKSIIIFKSINDSLGLSGSYNDLGVTFRKLGLLDSAMVYNMMSLKIREKLTPNSDVLAQNYASIGTLHGMMDNDLKAEQYFFKAEAIYLKTKEYSRLGDIWNKIAVNNERRDSINDAIRYYKKADSLFNSIDHTRGRALIANNLGILYGIKNDTAVANDYYKTAIELAKESKRINIIAKANINLGHNLYLQKDYNAAIKHYMEALVITEQTGKYDNLSSIYRNMSAALAGLGKYKEALEYKEKHFVVYDSVYSQESRTKINELEIQYQTEKKESAIALQQEEIKTLNEKSRADNLKKGLYAGGMVSALALFALSFFGFRQRMKKNRLAREKQEAIYQKEIEHKQKELTSQTLHLVQKNTFIQELKENLENIKNSPEKFKMEFRRIAMLLKKENASDKDWEVFKTYFADVHNDFDQKLKTIYPDISEKEIRLAAFLRMNLTTKEIAVTLNVLPDSIRKSKFRLKKKLGLDKDTELGTFLDSL